VHDENQVVRWAAAFGLGRFQEQKIDSEVPGSLRSTARSVAQKPGNTPSSTPGKTSSAGGGL